MIFTRRFKDFSIDELEDIQSLVNSKGMIVLRKMAENKKHNALIGNFKIPLFLGEKNLFVNHAKYQDRVDTINSFMRELDDMAKEAKRRLEKKKK